MDKQNKAVNKKTYLSKETIETLHKFIDRYGSNAVQAIMDRERSPASLLCKGEDKSKSIIDDSCLEEMYGEYLASTRKPALTFREYARVIRVISDKI